MERLRIMNLGAAGLHAISAFLIFILSSDFTLPITTNYVVFSEVTQSLEPTFQILFEIPLAFLVGLFFIVSASAHLYLATIGYDWYVENLKNGVNKLRWFEYAVSAGVMMVAISMLAGVYDLSSLLMVFSLVAIMNLLGLVMELHNTKRDKVNWLSYYLGCFAGIVPWVVVGVYFVAAAGAGDGAIPAFVYWIYGSLFVFFNLFAANMWLQYRGVGKWSDYLYGEKTYIVLSFVAKTALAWQVYAGTLQPA